MIEPRLFLCNNVTVSDSDPLRTGRKVVELVTQGSARNVNIRLENVTEVFSKQLSPRLIDLIEIAGYIFAADCATSRGIGWTEGKSIESWERDFQFIMAVREPSFWSRDEVQRTLIQVLQFLSNDKYSFEFRQLTKEQPQQLYLEFNNLEDWPFYNVDRVLMFSGGLDSLAGAVETAANGGNLVLVSHRPVSTMDKRLRQLFEELRQTYPAVQMLHIPVWIYKDKDLGREHTQRTRSFLFSALGTVVAESVRANGVRFFENGVVSLNLPIADEVVRARASRTTHPLVLDLFTKLYSLVTDREIKVDNPFLFKTKTEVVSVIATHGANRLIARTCSCAHQMFKSKTQWHCGTCSQCIDRRIAILAASQEEYDLEIDYVSDVFTGHRKDGYEKNMAVNYVRHAIELSRMDEQEMASKFNRDITRAVRSFPQQREAAQQIIEMHKRHGESVKIVLNQQFGYYSNTLLEGGLNSSSMLAMIGGQKHLISSWERYAERVVGLLKSGIPPACQTHKPKDEPHLQEICDGILKAHDSDLIREFPFMSWSSSSTKPDWSVESLQLWIELKYVRQKSDIRPITKDIAEDITKYGDNDRRVLYVVYDPSHLITNEKQFSEPIVNRRNSMAIDFIR
jgi:7-cyano-7-deazaguanine synthase in queuosine biosynthesis